MATTAISGPIFVAQPAEVYRDIFCTMPQGWQLLPTCGFNQPWLKPWLKLGWAKPT